MGVNGVPIFYIEKSLFMGAINHCFDNKSQTDPSPCGLRGHSGTQTFSYKFMLQRELFLSEVNNRETTAAIYTNNDMFYLQKRIEKFPLMLKSHHFGSPILAIMLFFLILTNKRLRYDQCLIILH